MGGRFQRGGPKRKPSRATNVAHATQDLYEAIERGDYPEWELRLQLMSDDEHPELDFDPLDDTALWPAAAFPTRAAGRMVLDRNPDNYFAEVEQAAFGAGVLVDGMDFSDDKMLQGRVFAPPLADRLHLALQALDPALGLETLVAERLTRLLLDQPFELV